MRRLLPLTLALAFSAAPVVPGRAQNALTPASLLLTAPQRDAGRSPVDNPAVSVSADGRYVAFASYARLSAADTNPRSDVYLLDRATGDITIQPATTEGRVTNLDSSNPRISGDGRFVAFETIQIAADDSPRTDVVIRDRTTGLVSTVSAGPNGQPADNWSRSPVVSHDGRYVAFVSSARNLVDEPDANGASEDVYLFDAATGRVRRISVDHAGRQLPLGGSFGPSISADGRRVAFVSSADLDGRAGPPPPGADVRTMRARCAVFVRDLELGRTVRVSTAGPARLPNGASFHPSLSGDGRIVVFASEASNLVRGDSNRHADIFLHDLETASTTLVSQGPERRSANGASTIPTISADGRFVAFQSEASNLICVKRCTAADDDINLVWDVFLFDRDNAVMTRASTDPDAGWMEPSGGVALDATGRVLAFSSLHPIDGRDLAHDLDLFVRVNATALPAVSAPASRPPRR